MEQSLINVYTAYIFQHSDSPLTRQEIFEKLKAATDESLTGPEADTAIQSLIDRGDVQYLENGGTYASREIAKRRSKTPDNGPVISRQMFDSMNPRERMDFIGNGGTVS
jgi:hypothetical protein